VDDKSNFWCNYFCQRKAALAGAVYPPIPTYLPHTYYQPTTSILSGLDSGQNRFIKNKTIK
jgi:hypothetical protein